MPLTPGQTKALLRERGWLMLDLAARWKISPAWASKLINHPELRNAIHEDAFAGLPHRGQVEVQRQARHMRKPRPKGWTLAQMFPVGRVFEALDSALMDEGTRMAVQGVHLGPPAAVIFAVIDHDGRLDPDAGPPFSLTVEEATVHLGDLCIDTA